MNSIYNHRLGLSVPLFCASLVAILIGAPILGLTGIWGYIVPGNIVPVYLKVMHAHVAWWSLIILLNALLVPGINMKQWFKSWIVWSSFLIIPIFVFLMIAHYLVPQTLLSLGNIGTFYVSLFGICAFILEIAFFATNIAIALLASGVRISGLTTDTNSPSRFDIQSDITIPGNAVRTYINFLMLGVLLGILILIQFNIQHKPVAPAGLVQFHTHIGFFAIGTLMTIIMLRALGVRDVFVTLMQKLGTFSLVTTTIGFLIFILLDAHSASWVVPAFIYYAFLILAWVALWGKFGLEGKDAHFDFVRGCLIFLWGGLLLFILAGPYIALQHDTNKNLTVSYMQDGGGVGGKHVGTYPDPTNYKGTAPNKGTPRGLENFHLSPASWAHVGIFWLIILLAFGKQLLGDIGKPNLIFMLAVIIAQAPVFNSIGRLTAWADLPSLPKFPGGPGPLYFIAHPLKTITIIILIIITIVWMRKMKK